MKIKKWILLSIFMVLFLACVAILIVGLIPGNDLSDNFYAEKYEFEIIFDNDEIKNVELYDRNLYNVLSKIRDLGGNLRQFANSGTIPEVFKNFGKTDPLINYIMGMTNYYYTLLQTYRIVFGVGMSLLATTFLGLMLWRFKKIYKISIKSIK